VELATFLHGTRDGRLLLSVVNTVRRASTSVCSASRGSLCVSCPRLVLLLATRSHPEMVGDISRLTLNSDLSKIPFVRF